MLSHQNKIKNSYNHNMHTMDKTKQKLESQEFLVLHTCMHRVTENKHKFIVNNKSNKIKNMEIICPFLSYYKMFNHE